MMIIIITVTPTVLLDYNSHDHIQARGDPVLSPRSKAAAIIDTSSAECLSCSARVSMWHAINTSHFTTTAGKTVLTSVTHNHSLLQGWLLL